MKILLNREQKQAVEYEGGPLLIIAGAGTGKTTVVTERIKWLITKKGYSPGEILALTFTEKAAAEMSERVDVALPLGYSQMWIATFHSFCERILRNEDIHIGLDPDFRLLTEAETVLFFRRHFFELDLEYFRPASNPTKFLKEMLNHFSRLRDEDITPEEYLIFAQKQAQKADTEEEELEAQKTKELAKAFSLYQELKEKEGVMDFADLISNTLALFRKRKNILKSYQEKFRHILVDEFQDTNIAQNELVVLLAGERKEVTVVADDDQSIYKWRGAAVSNVIQFKQRFPKTKIIVLNKNYRSTAAILEASYRLIQHNNPDRLEVKEQINKKLLPERQIKGKPIKVFWEEKVEQEADAVAQEIKKLTKKDYRYQDVAILVRANNHAEPFTRALARNGIPYQFLGPGQLFRQGEVKDLIAYLKIISDPEDDIALFRVCNLDVFGITGRDLAFINSFAKRYNLSLLEALEEITSPSLKEAKFPVISPGSYQGIKKLTKMIHRHLELAKKESGGQILYYFLHDSGLLKKYLDPKTEKEQIAALNIAKFFEKVKAFESQTKEILAAELLDWITLRMEMGESPLASEIDWTENNAVNILTVHSAKGLEFPVVFLVNLVNQRFPTMRRREVIPIPQPLIKEILPEGDSHEQEERRLFYVGMTRARDLLYFTGAKFYGEGKTQKKISPFVIEALGEKAVDKATRKKPSSVDQLALLDWEPAPPLPSKPPVNPPVTYLSYSQLDSFSICPRQYKYKYILRLPTPPSPAQTFGNIIHKTPQKFLQQQIKKKK
ncbi:ATP-dependent helicase, partial [bacterium]|nr:ATP-dependent helicase [bacterium]